MLFKWLWQHKVFFDLGAFDKILRDEENHFFVTFKYMYVCIASARI